MKTEELVVGHDYLYQTHNHDTGRRVRVLDTHVLFINRVDRPGSLRLHSVRHQNGVRIAFLNADGSRFLTDEGAGREEVVFPRRITRTWREEEARRLDEQRQTAVRRERLQARRDQLTEPLGLIRDLTGVDLTRHPERGGAHLTDGDIMRIAGALEGLAPGIAAAG